MRKWPTKSAVNDIRRIRRVANRCLAGQKRRGGGAGGFNIHVTPHTMN